MEMRPKSTSTLVQRRWCSDVGAGHPILHSVTKHFCDIGWSGLNVEPRRSLFEQLCESRPRDANKNCAVTDTAGEMVFFEIQVAADKSEDDGGLSTLDKHQLAVGR